MKYAKVFVAGLGIGAMLWLSHGCAGGSIESPETVDFSGVWQVSESDSDPVPDINKIFSEERKALIKGELNDPFQSAIFLKHDFPVLFNDTLMIEQDTESMGVSYTSSPYDDFKWGRKIQNGLKLSVIWRDTTLVIQKIRRTVRGTEQYSLDDDGNTLRVFVNIQSGNEKFRLNRIFRKN